MGCGLSTWIWAFSEILWGFNWRLRKQSSLFQPEGTVTSMDPKRPRPPVASYNCEDTEVINACKIFKVMNGGCYDMIMIWAGLQDFFTAAAICLMLTRFRPWHINSWASIVTHNLARKTPQLDTQAGTTYTPWSSREIRLTGDISRRRRWGNRHYTTSA